jgi:hypothetical protein
MKFFKENKKIVIIVLVVIFAFVIFSFFFKKDTGPTSLQTDGSFVSSQVPGRDLIIILRRLEGITLDGSIFQSAAFKSLTDFSLPLVKEPIGRDNPFAPVGFEGIQAASTSAETTAIESTGSTGGASIEGEGGGFGI